MAVVVAATASSAEGSNTTSHSITLPAHSTGDMLVVVFCLDGSSNTITGGLTGWSSDFGGTTMEQGANSVRLHVYWKLAASGSETLTITTSSSQRSAHVAFTLTGVDTSKNLGAKQNFTIGADGLMHTPDITSADDESCHFSVVASEDDAINTATQPSGWTAGPFSESEATGEVQVVTAYKEVSVGLVETPDWSTLGTVPQDACSMAFIISPQSGMGEEVSMVPTKDPTLDTMTDPTTMTTE